MLMLKFLFGGLWKMLKCIGDDFYKQVYSCSTWTDYIVVVSTTVLTAFLSLVVVCGSALTVFITIFMFHELATVGVWWLFVYPVEILTPIVILAVVATRFAMFCKNEKTKCCEKPTNKKMQKTKN